MTASPWAHGRSAARAITLLAQAADLMRAEQDRMMLEDVPLRRESTARIARSIEQAIDLLQPLTGVLPWDDDVAEGLIISDVQHHCHEAIIRVAAAVSADDNGDLAPAREALLRARRCARLVHARAQG